MVTHRHDHDLEQLNQEVQCRPMYLPGAVVTLESLPSCSEMLFYTPLDVDQTHKGEDIKHGFNRRVSDFKRYVADDVD